MEVQPVRRWYDVRLQHPHRVTVAQDCGEIVGLVDLLHEHGEGGLASAQHGAEAVEALRTHRHDHGGGRRIGNDAYISSFATPLATRPSLESAVRIPHTSVLGLVSLVAIAGCDRLGEVVLVPEYEMTESFESGFGAWSVRNADLGAPAGSWSAETTAATATDGEKSLSLQLDNIGGAGKLWIVREVELTPGQDYDVALSFDLGTSDPVGSAPWTIIAGALPTEPVGAVDLTFRGGTVPDSIGASGVTWSEKSYSMTLRGSSEGKGIVFLGVWGTTAENRTHHIDNVQAYFTRR
jgi:hypothetical protein